LRYQFFAVVIASLTFNHCSMQPQDYAYLYELEENFWWFVGMREVTRALLDPLSKRPIERVLDAGCGTGGMLTFLTRYAEGRNLVGIDYSDTALSFCSQRQPRQLARASVSELPFANETFDLVTSFDVLQHVDDGADARAIAEFHRVLRPNGIVFVRVCAYQWLRSAHDDSIAVQRRYSLPELSDLMVGAGFHISRATYANTILFPIAALKRLIFTPKGRADAESEVQPWPKGLEWLNQLLTLPLKVEARALSRINFPFGVSAIVIAEKRLPDQGELSTGCGPAPIG
jgi:ubiquinone/menaquinone biosynthesis C-methylase UbiE